MNKSLTVLKIHVDKSFGLLSSQMQAGGEERQGKNNASEGIVATPIGASNHALVTIGTITIDIPAHPVALHGMVSGSQMSS